MGAEEAFQLFREEEARRESRRRGPRGTFATTSGPSEAAERAYRLYQQNPTGDISDDDLARQFVGQESILEGKPLPIPTRFALSFLGDTFEEQRAVFQVTNPEGELVEVPNTDIVLFRRNRDDPFRKVDPGFLESLASSGVIGEQVADLADALGDDALVIPFEVALGKGSATFVKGLLRTAAGAAVGETAQQALQTAAGTQRQTPGEQAGEVSAKAITSIVGTTLGEGVGKTANLLTRRRALLEPTEEGARAFRAARSLRRTGVEVDDPLPIQVVDVPFVRLLGRQAAALLPRIGRALRAQEDMLARAMRSLPDRAARSQLRHRSVRLVEESGNDLREFLVSSLRFQPKSPGEAGRQMRRAVHDWWETTRGTVDDLYTRARALEEPEFDLTPAIETAQRIQRGVAGTGRDGELVPLRDLPAPLQREIDKLSALDPALPRVEGAASAMDVLREIRANLSDLALPGPEGARLPNRLAGELSGAIREVMDHPHNASPEFRQAWKAAQTSAAKRFQIREQAAVVDLLRTENLTQFADQLARPGQFENLVALSRAGGQQTLAPVRDAFRTQLLRNPYEMTRILESYDRPTLGILLDAKERRVVREMAKKFDDISQSGLRQAIERQTRVRPFIQDLADNPQSAGIDALNRVIQRNGGRTGELGISVRASLIDEVWRRSHVVEKGRRVLSSRKLNATLDDFNDRGLLQLLSFGEVKTLRDVELMARVSEVASDAGTSIQAASAAAGLRTLSSEAISTFIEQIGVGRLLTSDAGRQLLVGLGKTRKPLGMNAFRLSGAVAAQLAVSSKRPGTEAGFEDVESLAVRLSPHSRSL